MDSIESKPSENALESPEKSPPELKPQPADQISPSLSLGTPHKQPSIPRRFHHHRRSELPEMYEMNLRFFDALVASLKLLRLRKSVPFFTKIRVMIESISERRFTHQHLAQMKFLLPEMEIKRVLLPDEETRCMKYDLRLTLNINMMIDTKKRKRGSKLTSLRDCFISRLMQFLRDHPDGTEIPEEELPEPFSSRKQAPLSNTTKLSGSFSRVQKHRDASLELQAAQASHFSSCFMKRFSKGDQENESAISFQSLSEPSPQSASPSASNSSMNEDELLHLADVQSKQAAQIAKKKAKTPVKSAASPTRLMAHTPELKTPKRCSMSPDDKLVTPPNKVANRPSCARSLRFECPPKNVNIELQMDDDDDESSDLLDTLPPNLLLSLKKKEKGSTEQPKRKQMIANLPKLIDRIYYLFQRLKSSAITKEALIHDLTERHFDITDESEIEQQLTILQEIIPDWIFLKLSPSGKSLYSINKALAPNTLQLRLDNAM